MKDKALRAIWILFLIAVLAGGAVYAVSRYGTPDDPLVSMSYLTDVAERRITDQTDTQINAAVSAAQEEFDRQVRAAADVYQAVNLSSGQTLRCEPGTEVLLTAGSASSSGAFTDSTTGEALASGGGLTVNHLYLASVSGASIRAGESAALMVRGTYTIG